jgi:Arylsulfotransferase (ASST)
MGAISRIDVSAAIVAFVLVPGAVACSSSSAGTTAPDQTDGASADATASDAGTPADASNVDASDGSTAVVPTLAALSVTAAPDSGASTIALVPAFSPVIHDYYVRCGAGTNVLTVSMTASAGALSALSQPASSPASATQTQTVNVTENEAIVAVASEGTASAQYWVRCLPHDFPLLEMDTHPEAGAPPPGYYLVGNLMANASAGYAMVLDGDGVPVWYSAMPAGLGVVDVDDIAPGALSYCAYSATAVEPFAIHALSPASVTPIAPDGYATDSHELRLLPNGNYLVLSYPLKSGVDLTGLSVASTADAGASTPGPNSTIQDCAIVEFQPSGTVVSTWLASDHFDPVKDSTLPLTGFGANSSAADGGVAYDVFHCNSIDVDPSNGNLLVSAREMDSIFYVDRPTGKVLWKMGGATASLDDAAYVSVPDPFFRQHDARLQPGWSPSCNGGSGQISLFDDETQVAGPARGVVYDVVVGAADGGTASCDGGTSGGATTGQATVAWQYKGALSAAATGSFRISADGSRVIGWGFGGAPDLAFTEVDVNGNDLLDFRFPDGNSTYRAIKVPLTAFDLAVLRSATGAP